MSTESRDLEMLITPPSGLGSIDFKELWAYRELLGFLVWRDVSVRYKQSPSSAFYGRFITPLITMLIFTIIFGKARKDSHRWNSVSDLLVRRPSALVVLLAVPAKSHDEHGGRTQPAHQDLLSPLDRPDGCHSRAIARSIDRIVGSLRNDALLPDHADSPQPLPASAVCHLGVGDCCRRRSLALGLQRLLPRCRPDDPVHRSSLAVLIARCLSGVSGSRELSNGCTHSIP